MTRKTNDNHDNEKSILLQAVIAGYVSSSFYFHQLCIHLLSQSTTSASINFCATLNKTFGPIQPYSRSLTLSWLVMSWFSLSREEEQKEKEDPTTAKNDDQKEKTGNVNGTKASSSSELRADDSYNSKNTATTRTRRKMNFLFSSFLCLCLMYMPEGLKILGMDPVILAPAVKDSSNNSPYIKLEYTVDNMDCGGCVIEVEGLLTGQKGVVSAKVTTFDLGEVEIYVNTEWVEDYETVTFEKMLNETLVPHGFELHERGWKTKMMSFNERFPSN